MRHRAPSRNDIPSLNQLKNVGVPFAVCCEVRGRDHRTHLKRGNACYIPATMAAFKSVREFWQIQGANLGKIAIPDFG